MSTMEQFRSGTDLKPKGESTTTMTTSFSWRSEYIREIALWVENIPFAFDQNGNRMFSVRLNGAPPEGSSR